MKRHGRIAGLQAQQSQLNPTKATRASSPPPPPALHCVALLCLVAGICNQLVVDHHFSLSSYFPLPFLFPLIWFWLFCGLMELSISCLGCFYAPWLLRHSSLFPSCLLASLLAYLLACLMKLYVSLPYDCASRYTREHTHARITRPAPCVHPLIHFFFSLCLPC